MEKRTLRAFGGCLLLAMMAALAAPAQAQSCYTLTPTTTFKDLCNLTNETMYDYYGAPANWVVSVGGHSYLLYGYNNGLRVFNMDTPMSPQELPGYTGYIGLPWSEAGTHGALTPHLRFMATLDDFPYAFAGLYTIGWDFFKILPTPQFLGNGYSTLVGPEQSWRSGALFRNAGSVYLVGQQIDTTAINASDPSVWVYLIDDGQSLHPDGLSAATMSSNRVVRIPIGGKTDQAPYNTFSLGTGDYLNYFILSFTGKRYLLVDNSSQTALVDITNPTPLSTPARAMWTTANTDARLRDGMWAVDEARSKLYVGSYLKAVIHVFDISKVPSGVPPQYVNDVPWYLDGSMVPPANPGLVVRGDLLVVFSQLYMGYLSLGGIGGPVRLPADTTLNGIGVTKLVRSCKGPQGVAADWLTPFKVGGQQYVARSCFVWGDILQINQSCMNTTPNPSISVVRGSNQGSLDASCTGGDAGGYPGDTFTITNTSGGSWTNPALTVTPAGGVAQAVPGGPTTWTWTSPTTQTGSFTFDLSVQDQAGQTYVASLQTPPGNKTITLCGSPKVNVQVTAVWFNNQGGRITCTPSCSYLYGDRVQLAGVLQGHPTALGWTVTDPTGTAVTGYPQADAGLSTIDLLLNVSDTVGGPGYTVTVAAQYGFPGTNDANCSTVAQSILNASTYNACASFPVHSRPFSVGGITVSDGTTIASKDTNSSPPTLLKANTITFSVPYRVASASGYTQHFQWGLTNGTPPAVNDTGTTVTGTIAANTLAVGSYTASLTATAQQGSETPVTASVTPVSFNIIDCINPAKATPTAPANGSTQTAGYVTLQWNPPASGSGPFTYTVVGPLSVTMCDSTPNTSCQYYASVAATYKWQVVTSVSCSTTTSTSAAWSFTIPSTGGGGGGGGGNSALSISPYKNPANVNEVVTFGFSPTLSQSGDQLTFTFGDGQSGSITYAHDCQLGACPSAITHAYSSAGTFTVSGSGIAGGTSVSGSTSIQIQNNCPLPAPAASFTWSPTQVQAGTPVQFTDVSTGGPTTWAWDFGDGFMGIVAGGSSTAQNPIYTYPTTGWTYPFTFTVKLTATNCAGSSVSQKQITVLPACSAPGPPVADFTWGPTGTLASFPEQTQPYVRQPVTLMDASTNSPTSWTWNDFQELAIPPTTVKNPTFTATWTLPGDKNVRMTATNCVGTSAEKLKVVHIYDDVRHVTADFSWSPADVSTTGPVTFTAAQGYANGDPTDFSWSFDDGTTPSGASVAHTYKCSGSHKVTLTATRRNASGASYSATVTKGFAVSGTTCGPESVMAVDAAKVLGLNNTNWHADLRIFNASKYATNIWLEFLPAATDNVQPFKVGPYQPPLPPKGTLVLDDILQWAADNFKENFTKTALRITYKNDDNVAPIVLVRTYNLLPDGSKYGQMNPGIDVVPGTTKSPMWLTGLRNNGTDTGFRTNYSIVNLRGDTSCASCITFTMYDEAGAVAGTKSLGLWAFGYLQDSIKNLFGASFANIGTFSLKIDIPAGQDMQAYASVMDNLTGDPVMITATTPADSPIYLVAMAHNSGVANTVWRTDLQLTNPDSAGAHSWEVKYLPKAQDGLPVVVRAVTLAPDKSLFVDDAVAWAYAGLLPADAETSGVIRIAPTDGMGIYPMVSARSYNQTANGTYGQGVPALWAARGISATSDNKRLLLTGMSSEDIARTNLGFINLSETDGVDMAVYFYGESGNLLNPNDMIGTPIPYTFAIGPGGWDQDKLENRFNRAFKSYGVTLPSNLRSISAEVVVRGGGPAFVYASVIDSLTGDPNFIAAQPDP